MGFYRVLLPLNGLTKAGIPSDSYIKLLSLRDRNTDTFYNVYALPF